MRVTDWVERVKVKSMTEMQRANDFLTSDKSKTCPWLFGFVVEVSERTYNLHSPTRSDMEHWVHLFEILVKMAKAGITTK